MKVSEAEVGKKYLSNVNTIAKNCQYEILEKKKTVCSVVLWDNGVKTTTIYNGVPYRVLS